MDKFSISQFHGDILPGCFWGAYMPSKHVPVYLECRNHRNHHNNYSYLTLRYSVNNEYYTLIYDHRWRGIFHTKVKCANICCLQFLFYASACHCCCCCHNTLVLQGYKTYNSHLRLNKKHRRSINFALPHAFPLLILCRPCVGHQFACFLIAGQSA